MQADLFPHIKKKYEQIGFIPLFQEWFRESANVIHHTSS